MQVLKLILYIWNPDYYNCLSPHLIIEKFLNFPFSWLEINNSENCLVSHTTFFASLS